jgi:hypothetical protein
MVDKLFGFAYGLHKINQPSIHCIQAKFIGEAGYNEV